MRMIGTVPGEDEAQQFTAYLLTQGIDAHAEKADTSNHWLIWVEHDDLIDRGRQELLAFNAAPGDPKYAVESDAARIRREKDRAAERRRKNYTDMRTKWSGVQQFATPVTIALVGLCVLIFLSSQGESRFLKALKALAFEPPAVASLEDRDWTVQERLAWLQARSSNAYAEGTESIRHGQIWRLFTPMLMHGGFAHILFNMMWLLSMGGRLEARKGPLIMLAVVLIGGAIAHSSEAIWEIYSGLRENPAAAAEIHQYGLPFLGMSGVNYAIFGFVWVYGRLRPADGLSVQPQDIGLAVGWLVICMLGFIGNIANAAHLMGLVAGVAMAWVYVRGLRGSRRV
jgi:GlpG protein